MCICTCLPLYVWIRGKKRYRNGKYIKTYCVCVSRKQQSAFLSASLWACIQMLGINFHNCKRNLFNSKYVLCFHNGVCLKHYNLGSFKSHRSIHSLHFYIHVLAYTVDTVTERCIISSPYHHNVTACLLF